MSATHTPGPWVAEPADMFGDHNIVLHDASNDARAIAAVVSNMRDESEVAANAHLIASAPDLLAALVDILGPLNVCSDNPHVPDNACLPVDMTMGELRRARIAIAKARGGDR